MACFSAGLGLAPGHGGPGGVHGLPLNSSCTAWMFGGAPCPCCPVRVHTSCAAICWRTAGLALAATPVRLTVAVVPSTITLTFLTLERGGNAVTAGGAALPWGCSQSGCGLASSAVTRLVARDPGEVPAGTN